MLYTYNKHKNLEGKKKISSTLTLDIYPVKAKKIRTLKISLMTMKYKTVNTKLKETHFSLVKIRKNI